jgi:hypothetical protein
VNLAYASASKVMQADNFTFNEFKNDLYPEILAVEEAETLYWKAMHNSNVVLHVANYHFDDVAGNEAMATSLNEIFEDAAPDYKIWHGAEPSENPFCDDDPLTRVCDWENITLWDVRLEQL